MVIFVTMEMQRSRMNALKKTKIINLPSYHLEARRYFVHARYHSFALEGLLNTHAANETARSITHYINMLRCTQFITDVAVGSWACAVASYSGMIASHS